MPFLCTVSSPPLSDFVMGSSGLLVLVFVLKVAHCLEVLDSAGEKILEVTRNVTAVLGEDVYLSCRYVGHSEILSSQWKRQVTSKITSKRMAGFYNGKAFSRDNFTEPDSLTNLTVRMKVSSVDVEGKYICEFASDEEDFTDGVFLTVLARPDVQMRVTAETINGSHYQSVSCSAVGGRPEPQIGWLVDGRPPSDPPFTVDVSKDAHSNGTSTLSSVLRFPTRLLDEDSVTCVVRHPALPNPRLATARVETYTRPNVTVKAEMVQRGGSDFWVVSCISSGGRPAADIALASSTGEELQREDEEVDSDMQRRSVLLPATGYGGPNVTCVFDHPKFTHKESRGVTLPSFYVSKIELQSELSSNGDGNESLEVQEGESNTVVRLQITGNVPHYNITCRKDDGPLPEGVELAGSSLVIQGPVEPRHGGLYQCCSSYHHLKATLKFNITVRPQVTQIVPPTIRVDSQTEDGRRVIECSAADAVPAANMSWLLPEGVSGVSWFNFTSHNGSHSVRGVLLLPACSPWELAAECVINHPAFEEPENRSVTLPLCARVNVTVGSSAVSRDGDEYTEVDCSVESVAPAATITWHVGDSSLSSLTHSQVQADGSVWARSSARFLSSLYSGQNLTCTVEHPSLEAPEKRTIHIPVHKASPVLSVSVVRQQDAPLWLAVCDCRGGGVGANLVWLLPDNAKGQTSLQSEHEGRDVKARLTYQFPLALHEGQDLTCVYHFEHGATEEKTIHIPRYYITAVRVLNHTTPLQSRYGGEPVAHRLALQEHHLNQRVLLGVEGNVPEYNLHCERSDGSFVPMEGAAMVFESEVTERDEGLYSCRASFYHHTAAVNIQVEVANGDKQLALVSIFCMSLSSAILLTLVVILWVCCKTNSKTQYKQRESLSVLTSLMMAPGSPEVKKPAATQNGYSIVIDIKSTV